ncbi:MAG: hypothetical protein ACTS73_06750 [Arsenophonus sp. NEOnobi-MAG3]
MKKVYHTGIVSAKLDITCDSLHKLIHNNYLPQQKSYKYWYW